MKIIFEKHFLNKSSLGVKRFYKFIFNKFKNTDYLIEEEENYFPYLKKYKSYLYSSVHLGSLIQYNQTIVVHDMISYRWYHKGIYKFLIRCYYMILFRIVKKIIVFSNFEKNYLIKTFLINSKKIKVLRPKYDRLIIKKEYSLPFEDYFLMITNDFKKHKNNDVVIDFFKKNINYNLVIVGYMITGYSNILSYKNIDDDFLNFLIKKSKTIISPSMDEGFNLPVYDCITFLKKPIVFKLPIYKEFYNDIPFFFDQKNIFLSEIILNNDNYILNKKYLKKMNLNSSKEWLESV